MLQEDINIRRNKGNGAWNGGTSKDRHYGMGFNRFLKNRIRKLYNHRCVSCNASVIQKQILIERIGYPTLKKE